MLKLKNVVSTTVDSRDCGSFDGNCIFCDGQKWDFNV